MFVRVANEEVNNVALVSLRAELWQQLCEIRVAHAIDRLAREIPGLIQRLDDVTLFGGGFVELARFESCRRIRTHHAEESVAFSSYMQKHFGKGPGVGRGAPGEFVARKYLGKIDALLIHLLQVEKRLGFHVIAGCSAVYGGVGSLRVQ